MHIKFEKFLNEGISRTYNDFLMDLLDYLVNVGVDTVKAEECIYYYQGKGWLQDCWEQGCNMKETVEQMKDDDGKITWFK